MSDKSAILSNLLYVPADLVQPEHLDAYTYRVEQVQSTKQDHLPPICQNCQLWDKKWRKPDQGTCASRGYTLTDSCRQFRPKTDRQKVEVEVLTWSREDDYYLFPRGDLGKLDKVFRNIDIVDSRVAPPLGFDLEMKEDRVLRPDQQAVADQWLTCGYGIVQASTGWGKCAAHTTLVATKRGIIQIKDLVKHRRDDHAEPVTDLNVVASGGYDQPVSHTYYQERKPTLRVLTERGYEVTGTRVHPLQVLDPDKGLVWKTLGEMAVGDFVAVRPFPLHGDPVRITPLLSDLEIHSSSNPVSFPDVLTPDLAELLGHLTADGSLGTRQHVWYTKADPVLVQRVRDIFAGIGLVLKTAAATSQYYACSVVFHDVIERLGVAMTTAHHTVIPWSCLQSGPEVAAGFLRGLFSGDCHVDAWKRELAYTTASRELAKTLQVLLLGFDIVSTLRVKPVIPPGHTEPVDYYVVTLTRQFLSQFQDKIGFVPGSEKDQKLASLLALDTVDAAVSPQQLYRYPINGVMRRVYKRHGLRCGARSINLEQCLGARGTPPNPAQLRDFLHHLRKDDCDSDTDVAALQEVSDLAAAGVVFTPVVSIEDAGEQEVFDLSVPGTEWFVGNGIVNHNTVLMCYLLSKLRVRTLILADKVRHLQVVAEGLQEHTNIRDLERECGVPIFGILGEEVGFKPNGDRYSKEKFGVTYPITLSTYQSLTSKRGQKLLPTLRNQFGAVWHEEGHHEAADTFHAVTKSFNPYYRGGQTATPTRGDKMHVVMYDTIGPVTAKATTQMLVPKVQFIHTQVQVPDWCFRGQYAFTSIETFLAKDRTYFDCILETINEDLSAGRKVLLFSKRKALNYKLKQALHMMGWTVEVIDGDTKAKEQSWYSEKLLSGELNAIVGTTVIQENYNIPPLDCLHLPFANFTKETELQIVGRVLRTNVANKPQPLVRVYTWTANQKAAEIATHWRRNLYTSLGYEFDTDRNLGPSLAESLRDDF